MISILQYFILLCVYPGSICALLFAVTIFENPIIINVVDTTLNSAHILWVWKDDLICRISSQKYGYFIFLVNILVPLFLTFDKFDHNVRLEVLSDKYIINILIKVRFVSHALALIRWLRYVLNLLKQERNDKGSVSHEHNLTLSEYALFLDLNERPWTSVCVTLYIFEQILVNFRLVLYHKLLGAYVRIFTYLNIIKVNRSFYNREITVFDFVWISYLFLEF